MKKMTYKKAEMQVIEFQPELFIATSGGGTTPCEDVTTCNYDCDSHITGGSQDGCDNDD